MGQQGRSTISGDDSELMNGGGQSSVIMLSIIHLHFLRWVIIFRRLLFSPVSLVIARKVRGSATHVEQSISDILTAIWNGYWLFVWTTKSNF